MTDSMAVYTSATTTTTSQRPERPDLWLAASSGEVSDQAWFWTPEWQEGEREVDEAIAAGRTTYFGSADEFLAALDLDAP
jgi:hypothetical protein